MHDEQSRRERKKDETRHRIFHAAIDLFRERGFEHTTVDDITEKADVGRGTFFNYFPRKEAVLAYHVEGHLLALEEDLEGLLAQDRPARERLLDLLTSMATVFAEDHDLTRYVLTQLMTRMYEPSHELMNRWREVVVGLVREGQERGEFRRDVPCERIEGALGCIVHGTVFQWVHCRPSVFPLVDELRARLTLAMEGIAS